MNHINPLSKYTNKFSRGDIVLYYGNIADINNKGFYLESRAYCGMINEVIELDKEETIYSILDFIERNTAVCASYNIRHWKSEFADLF